VRRIKNGVLGLVNSVLNGLQFFAKPRDIVLFGFGPLLLLLERLSKPGECCFAGVPLLQLLGNDG